jgi:hypothetical protein
MKRLGALVTFKPGVTREQAEAALAGLQGLIDPRITYPHTDTILGDGRKWKAVDYSRPVTDESPAAMIEEFNDEHGGPVWYIP